MERAPEAQSLVSVLTLFGFPSLKAEQHILIDAQNDGHHVLGVMPTGFGKSACFQIPGIMSASRTIVISPLIALQEDQVQRLRALGVNAYALHSNLPETRRRGVYACYRNAARDEPCFLYLSPEMFGTTEFREKIGRTRPTDRLVVDEAHCVSTWGATFRPEYQRIGAVAKAFGITQIAAFTATMDTRIEADIRKWLGLAPDAVRVEVSPLRPNITLALRTVADHAQNHKAFWTKFEVLCGLLKVQRSGATIVYCSTRSKTATLFSHLAKMRGFQAETGIMPLLFHANLPLEDKELGLHAFREHPRPVVLATSAFGMGIDRPDVRQVIHYDLPYSLVDYAQQFGRAGRDGEPALCTTITSNTIEEQRLTGMRLAQVPTVDSVVNLHARLAHQAEKARKLKKRFTLRGYLARLQAAIANDDDITAKEVAFQRVHTAAAILSKVGAIAETPQGLVVHDLEPATPAFEHVIEETRMRDRMIVREARRVLEFFVDSKDYSQERLWEILRRD